MEPHPPQSAWIGRYVRSPIDKYEYRDGLWKVIRLETFEDQIRFLLRKRGREVWTDWQFNHWK